MPISQALKVSLSQSSWIRRMFEEGSRLRKERGEQAVCDFSLGNPDVEPPALLREALIRAASDCSAGIHGYMPNAGYPAVRQAIAKKVSQEHQLEISGHNVVVTVGAAGGLNVAIKTICDPGDEIIVPRPYFAEYVFYCQNHQARLVPVDSAPDFSLSVENIKRALTGKTAAVLINTPNNPTGRVYTRQQLTNLAQVLLAHGQQCGRMPYLLVDEPYRELVYDRQSAPPVLDCYPDTIVVSSYSKSLSIPGERIGYLAASPRCAEVGELMDGLVMCNRTLGYVNAPGLMQRVVAELVGVNTDISAYERRRNLIVQVLDRAGLRYAKPEGAFYAFCQAPGDHDVALVMHLKEFGILCVPGTGFGFPGWFRLAYCVSEETIKNSESKFIAAMNSWNGGRA